MRTSRLSSFWLFFAVMEILSPVVAHAQVTWRRTYGGFGSDVGHSVLQSSDGGYLALGSTGSFGWGSSDFYLVKLDPDGDLVWSATYGTPSIDQGWSIAQGTNGYVLVGYSSDGVQGYDGMMICIDDQGTELWRKTYGTPAWNFLFDVASSPSGFYMIGQTFSGFGNGDEWLIHTDLNGDTLWTRSFGTGYEDVAHGVVVTPDGGCVVSGTIGTADGTTDASLTKFSPLGEVQWQTSLGGASNEIGYGVTRTNDGGYVLGGTTESSSQYREMFLAKVDPNGSPIWSQHIGQLADWEGHEVREKANGELVLVGYTKAFGGGGRDVYVLFTDPDGNFLSGTTYGGQGDDEGWSVDVTFDGGVVVAGSNKSSGPGIEAVYVVKGDEQGETADLQDHPYFDPLPVTELTKPAGATISPTLLSSGEEMTIIAQGHRSALARISDMRGATQAVIPVEAGTRSSIRVPDLAPGPYLISIEQKGQAPIVAKFVVIQ